MTRSEVLTMLADGGLDEYFSTVDRGYILTTGHSPKAYVIPQWLYDVLKILQLDTPRWRGHRLDPWDKDEIRGME